MVYVIRLLRRFFVAPVLRVKKIKKKEKLKTHPNIKFLQFFSGQNSKQAEHK